MPAREFLLMVVKGDDARMLNTTAATFDELRAAILARCGCEPEHDWTISLLAAGQEPAAVAAFGDLPAPRQVRGRRKTRAKLRVARG